jgi:flagellar hook-length control protein FliK
MKTTSTPAVEWPPGGAAPTRGSATPGRATTDFGALLDQHQARTAIAEGPKRDGDRNSVTRRDDRRDDVASARPERTERPNLPERLERSDRKDAPEAGEQQAPAADANPAAEQVKQPERQAGADGQTADQQPKGEHPAQGDDLTGPVEVVEVAPVLAIFDAVAAPVPAEAVTAVAVAVAVAAPPTDAAVPVAVAAAQDVAAAAPGAPVATPVVADQVIAVPVAQAAPLAEAVVAAAGAATVPVAVETASAVEVAGVVVPQQQQQQQQQPAGPQGPQLDAPVARAATQAAPADGQAQQQAGQQESPQAGSQQQSGDQPVATTAQQPVAAAAADGPRADRSQPAAAPTGQSATPVTAPAAPTAPQPFGREPQLRGVHLSNAAEAVENAIRIGTTRGITHARMSLNPAELGGIEIRLQQTAQGLSASVVASGAEAAQVLQQAGQDLRRQLEAQGIELVRLDISYSGEQREGARSAQAGQGDGDRRSPAGEGSAATDGGELTPTDEIGVTTLELPGGVLVDVLA